MRYPSRQFFMRQPCMMGCLKLAHRGKSGGYLDSADAFALIKSGIEYPDGFHPKSTTKLARDIFVLGNELHVKLTRHDAEETGAKYSQGHFKKKRFVTTLDLANGITKRRVLLTAYDRTAADGSSKLMPGSRGNVEEILREEKKARKIQEMTSSPHVIQPAKVVFVYNKQGRAGAVQRCISLIAQEASGDAETVIGNPRVTLVEQLAVARDAALGLQAIHDAGYAHRDVTAANILVDRDQNNEVTGAKIGDLGFAIRPKKIMVRIATAGAYPPEVVDRNKVSRHYTFSDDIYALAAVISKISTSKATSYETITLVTQELHDITRECTVSDPKARPTGEKVAGRLEKLIQTAKANEERLKAQQQTGEGQQATGLAMNEDYATSRPYSTSPSYLEFDAKPWDDASSDAMSDSEELTPYNTSDEEPVLDFTFGRGSTLDYEPAEQEELD